MNKAPTNDFKNAIDSISKDNEADVLLINAPMEIQCSFEFIDYIRARTRRKNVFVILVTSGGDAHSAYRVGRVLQNKYEKIVIFVSGWCKSAGTLLAIAANELIVGDYGELGPIDVQRLKPDEVWQRSSGLTETSSIVSLEMAIWEMYESFLDKLKNMSGGKIGFKAAADAVSSLVVGAFSPIFGQIDPLKIGENARAIQIATDYGYRLNATSKNLKRDKSMHMLVSSYPDHGFVIDGVEAAEIFKHVREPNENEEMLFKQLGGSARIPLDDMKADIKFLNEEIKQPKRNEKPRTGKGPTNG